MGPVLLSVPFGEEFLSNAEREGGKVNVSQKKENRYIVMKGTGDTERKMGATARQKRNNILRRGLPNPWPSFTNKKGGEKKPQEGEQPHFPCCRGEE